MNKPVMKINRIPRESAAAFDLCWTSPGWRVSEVVRIAHFQARGSDHRPATEVRLVHDDRSLWVGFEVHDRFVRSVSRQYQDMVCRDSCVEFFVQPVTGGGYFSFEVSAGGTLLLYYITDPERVPGGFRAFEKVPWSLAKSVEIKSSLPGVIEPEITEPVVWGLGLRIPLKLFEHYAGPLGSLAGTTWRGNYFKCGDATSHPHWGMWSPVLSGWSFHQPEFFGHLIFPGGGASSPKPRI